MSNQIMRNLLELVRSCIFLVMCDEYSDVSNKEQLTFCMRWMNLEDSENFLGFYEIPDIKGSTTVTVMKDMLLRYQLNLDMCRVQCYVGASNMLRKSSGGVKGTSQTLPCSFSIAFGQRYHQKY